MGSQGESIGAGQMYSPFKWALLGIVVERPSYGYELARRLERLYGDMLHGSYDSRVYKALDTLAERKLIEATGVESTVAVGTDRQPKRHYQATALGLGSYRGYLVEQLREARRHSQLLARHLAAFAGQPQMALTVIDALEEACLDEAVRAPIVPPPRAGVDSRLALVAGLTGEERRLAMEGTLQWIDYARAMFRTRLREETSE
jgi:DNA-binding PadR family transcriptional regulator